MTTLAQKRPMYMYGASATQSSIWPFYWCDSTSSGRFRIICVWNTQTRGVHACSQWSNTYIILILLLILKLCHLYFEAGPIHWVACHSPEVTLGFQVGSFVITLNLYSAPFLYWDKSRKVYSSSGVHSASYTPS
jgi:hypothetical protein